MSRRDQAPSRVQAAEEKVPQMKKVGNFLIDLDKPLGQGQYGKVYLA